MINAFDCYLTPQHLVLSLEPVLGGNLKEYLDVRASKAHHGYVLDENEARFFFQVSFDLMTCHVELPEWS